MDTLKETLPADCPQPFLDLALKCCAYYPKDRLGFDEIIQTLNDIIQDDPDFEDENALENWYLLSDLNADILDTPSSGSPIIIPKEDRDQEDSEDTTDDNVDSTTTNTATPDQDDDDQQQKRTSWRCVIC
eukprot:gene14611-17278_t